MMNTIEIAAVEWSRWQFALTAMFHWIFVPLTLGLGFLVAFMETIYYKTGNPEWKRITKFWMTIFGINFAIGVATGIILEFQFGTNWSNYSWFVGDIFGAPLAIEGIMAFFLESTFVAVMFFGWGKVSPKFHLTSTWLTAIGANLSALWILVANAWMQNPVGMEFNPVTARNEMVDFWAVLFSETAVNKYLHTTTSGFVLASVVVVGISSWFLIKNRHQEFAKKSIIVASTFGILASLWLIGTGDSSAREIAHKQPMKFAAMEAIYDGQKQAPLVAIGLFGKVPENPASAQAEENFGVKIEIPNMLSLMTFLDPNAYVPGVKNLINGNPEEGIMSVKDKILRGHEAVVALKELKEAQKSDPIKFEQLKAKFADPHFQKEYFKYFGYGAFYSDDAIQLDNNTYKVIPPISLTFYAFRIMVFLGLHFLALFIVMLVLTLKNRLEGKKIILWTALLTIPLAYIAQQSGWIVAEVGRQPWVIQDLMPTIKAVSAIDSTSVIITFWLFAITFTALFIAEIRIMLKQIKNGPKEDGGNE